MVNSRYKFRAWDSLDRKMIYNITETKKSLNIDGGYDVIGFDDYLNDGLGTIVMQFTGLLDKNGKEIYEGDIIKRIKKEPSKFHFEIYDPNPTVSEIFYDKAGFFVKGIKGMDFYLGAVHEKVEVIGNIYENPKLLKEYLELTETEE